MSALRVSTVFTFQQGQSFW